MTLVPARRRSRFGRYATSTKNITGCTLAIGGPALALLGVVAPPVGLALVPVLYAAGALAAPRRKPEHFILGVDATDVRRSLDQIRVRTAGRVPGKIALKINSIATTILDAIPRVDALGPGAHEQFVLVQCATSYLPEALQSYLDLPRSYADHHIVSDGKTALDLLSEQLDVLLTQVTEVADAVHRVDTDKLVANGRFLADKFGTGPLDLDAAPSVGDAEGGEPPAGDGRQAGPA